MDGVSLQYNSHEVKLRETTWIQELCPGWQSWLSIWPCWEALRQSIKHLSGCVCESSRRGLSQKRRPTLNVGSSNIPQARGPDNTKVGKKRAEQRGIFISLPVSLPLPTPFTLFPPRPLTCALHFPLWVAMIQAAPFCYASPPLMN